MLNLKEGFIWATTLAPATDAAGRNGTAVSIKQGVRVYIIYYIDQGSASTIALAPEQCSAVAGTGNKAIPTSQIFANQDMVASSVLVKQTAAVSFTTSATTKRKIVIFEIDPSAMDVANGFDCVRAVTGASSASNLTSGLVVMESRYQSQSTSDAMVD